MNRVMSSYILTPSISTSPSGKCKWQALSEAAGPMAQYGGKGNFGANALSWANAAGGKAMSMMGQAVKAGTNAAMYRNPVYQSYQDAISFLENKSNGLLTRPNANGGGVTPKEMLQNLSGSQPATTATQKISDTATSVKNVSSGLANGIMSTLSDLEKKIRK